MKIEWLNPEMTEAVVTRGIFRKRQAQIRRVSTNYSDTWVFMSGRSFPYPRTVECHRDAELRLRDRDLDWQPVRSLPRAEVNRG